MGTWGRTLQYSRKHRKCGRKLPEYGGGEIERDEGQKYTDLDDL
jgi:hypothetical protein